MELTEIGALVVDGAADDNGTVLVLVVLLGRGPVYGGGSRRGIVSPLATAAPTTVTPARDRCPSDTDIDRSMVFSSISPRRRSASKGFLGEPLLLPPSPPPRSPPVFTQSGSSEGTKGLAGRRGFGTRPDVGGIRSERAGSPLTRESRQHHLLVRETKERSGNGTVNIAGRESPGVHSHHYQATTCADRNWLVEVLEQ